MTDYDHFPPIAKFKRVLQSCPQAALLFIYLWKLSQKNNTISMKRKEIKKKFLISPTLFRNHLLALGRLDILSFAESTEFFLIDFASTHDV